MLTTPTPPQLRTTGAKNATFCAIYILKRSYYQDRLGINIGKSTQNQYVFLRFRSRAYRDGLTVAGLAYPEAPRPTLFYYAEVSAGQFTLTVQNADDFDAAATSLGYTWKVSWVAFI